MKRTILLITLAVLFALVVVGFVWAQDGDAVIWPIPTTPAYDTVPVDSQYSTTSPLAYLPIVARDFISPTPAPTSTPGAGP